MNQHVSDLRIVVEGGNSYSVISHTPPGEDGKTYVTCDLSGLTEQQVMKVGDSTGALVAVRHELTSTLLGVVLTIWMQERAPTEKERALAWGNMTVPNANITRIDDQTVEARFQVPGILFQRPLVLNHETDGDQEMDVLGAEAHLIEGKWLTKLTLDLPVLEPEAEAEADPEAELLTDAPAEESRPHGLVCKECEAGNWPAAAFCWNCHKLFTPFFTKYELAQQRAQAEAKLVPCARPGCTGSNPRGTKFCSSCGHPQSATKEPEPPRVEVKAERAAIACLSCGASNSPVQKACVACGKPPRQPPKEVEAPKSEETIAEIRGLLDKDPKIEALPAATKKKGLSRLQLFLVFMATLTIGGMVGIGVYLFLKPATLASADVESLVAAHVLKLEAGKKATYRLVDGVGFEQVTIEKKGPQFRVVVGSKQLRCNMPKLLGKGAVPSGIKPKDCRLVAAPPKRK